MDRPSATQRNPGLDSLALDEATVALLPKRVAELVDVVGLTAALKIVELRGGGRLEVPKRVKVDHWLVEHIGLDALGKLVAYYNGERIEIDRCADLVRSIQEQAIVAAHDNGASNWQLAQQFGYTERGIRKLRKRVAKGKPSPNMDWIADLL